MKFIKAFIVVLLTSSLVYAAGYYAPYGFRYIPQLTTQGTTDYGQIVINETATDALLNTLNITNTKIAQFKTLGDAGYTTLGAAITTIGSTPTTLIVPSGAWVGGGVTVPANVTLAILNGGYFTIANGTTLTINGTIEAGPYQIFNWTGTGTVVLSNCLNSEFPLEWMGGTTASADVGMALNKYLTALANSSKVIKLGHGKYTLTTPIAVETTGQCLSIVGQSIRDSVLWVAMTGTDVAISQGIDEDGGYAGIIVSSIVMKNFTFAGGVSCCKNFLKLAQCTNIDLDINFWGGCTDFAAIIGNCDWAKARLYTARGRSVPNVVELASLGEPAKGFYLTNGNGASINGNNASNFYINSEGLGCNPALEVSPNYAGGGASGESMNIEFSTENWEDNPLVIDGKGALTTGGQNSWCRFVNVHIEAGYIPGDNVILIKNVYNVSFDGFEVAASGCQVQMSNTKNISWNNYFFEGGITIAPDCQATTFGIGITGAGVENYAGSETLFLNGPNQYARSYHAAPIGAEGQDFTNYIYNVQMNRWRTSLMDGGWQADTFTTYTRESSNVHVLPDCAKFVYTDTAPDHTGFTYYNFDAYQLQQFKAGHYVTASAWVQLKAGDTYTNYPLIVISFECPARVNSTAYKLGEGVKDASGNTYVCVAVTGDSTSGGSIPTWNTTDGAVTVDGNVTWRIGMCVSNSSSGDFFGYNVGNWYRLMTGAYCPSNAVAGAMSIYQYPQTGGGNGTLYVAEPALMLGRFAPRSYMPNNPNEILLPGAVKVTSDSVIPSNGSSNINGKWSCVGDRCKNNGASTALTSGNVQEWGCTVAGINGSSSTWAAVSNVP